MNKKANIIDILFSGIWLFVFAIVLIMAALFLSEMNTGLTDSDQFDQSALDIIQEQDAAFAGMWDKAFGFVLVGLSTFTFISAFFIRSHPVFFLFGFFLIVIYLFVFAIISDAYVELTEQEALTAQADRFPIMRFVFLHYPSVMAILGLITAIITYSKGGEPSF